MSANDELQAHTCEKLTEEQGNRHLSIYDEAVSLTEENKQLRKWCEEFNALDVAKENKKLKELLKECRKEIDKTKSILTEDTSIDNTVVAHAVLRKLLTKIDEVLK